MIPEKKLILLIDDDSICNSINKILISRKLRNELKNDTSILSYTEPTEALKFLKNSINEKLFLKIIVLLDINMPIMTGWEFMEEYSTFLKNEVDIRIFILTSSVNQGDIHRAKSNPDVEDFISKPITNENLSDLFKLI